MKSNIVIASLFISASSLGIMATAATGGSISGKVSRLLLAPRGEVDGLLLQDGTRVQFPPHMGGQLAAVVQANDVVDVTTAEVPMAMGTYGRSVRAESIKDQRTGKTLENQPPSAPPAPPSEGRTTLEAKGTVAHVLVNDHGDADGLLLSDGTQLHFPPPVGMAFMTLYKQDPKASLKASGPGTTTTYGKVLDATALAYNGKTVPMDARPDPRGLPPSPPHGGPKGVPPPPDASKP